MIESLLSRVIRNAVTDAGQAPMIEGCPSAREISDTEDSRIREEQLDSPGCGGRAWLNP
jgi:hypothetical protein